MVQRVALLMMLPIFFLAACQMQENTEQIEGVWLWVSGTYTTPDTTVELQLDVPNYKLITRGHFAFGRKGEFGAHAGGGYYEFDGEIYSETVIYHSNPAADDATHDFEVRIEGDSLLYQTGMIGDDLHLEEVWRRVQ